MQEFQIRSWNRFYTRNLRITADLIGQSHEFFFSGASITIRLPGKEQVDRGPGFDEIASRGTYRLIDEVEVPQNYHIYKADVEVNLGAVALLDPAVLTAQANAYELVDGETQEKLNQDCEVHETIAAQAFEYWLSVLRWVSDDYSIGRHAVIANHSGFSTYLHEVQSGGKVWIQSVMINVPGARSITTAHWLKAAARLTNGEKAFPHITILHEAEEYYERGEYRRCLIDMAVATELYVRAVCMSRLPEKLEPYFYEKIDRINISELMEKVFPKYLDREETKAFLSIKAELVAMFKARNQVMHMADYGVANAPTCKMYLRSAKVLIKLSRIQVPSGT